MKKQENNRNHNRRSHPVRRADKKELHFPYQEQCPPILDNARISSSKLLVRFDMSKIDKCQHSKLIQKHTKGGRKKHGTIGQCHLIYILLCVRVGHLLENNSIAICHLCMIHIGGLEGDAMYCIPIVACLHFCRTDCLPVLRAWLVLYLTHQTVWTRASITAFQRCQVSVLLAIKKP